MRTKRNMISFLKYIVLPIFLIWLFFALKWLFSDVDTYRKEKAYDHILNCQNAYAFWQGVNGRSCDEARKFYYEYTEEEWREAKKELVDFKKITEQDFLYDELEEELKREEGYK